MANALEKGCISGFIELLDAGEFLESLSLLKSENDNHNLTVSDEQFKQLFVDQGNDMWKLLLEELVRTHRNYSTDGS